MNELTVRKATAGDCDAVARLVNAAYRPEPGGEGWTHESRLVAGDRTSAAQVEDLLTHSVILLGIHGSQIVACIQIASKDTDAHIGLLAVSPEIQRAGVGKAMLTHAEAYAESSLGAQQFIVVVVAVRVELIQFYCRRGYQDTGHRLPYPVAAGVGTPREGKLDLVVLCKRPDAWLTRKRDEKAPVR